MTKPFGVMEMLSRVGALLRRAAPPAEEPVRLTCGGLELDPRRRTVTVQGEEVSLTFKEFELLAYLLRNKGLVLTREQIMRAVWDSTLKEKAARWTCTSSSFGRSWVPGEPGL